MPATPIASRTYRVGASSITLAFDNILKSDAQVLVSSDDYMLSMGGRRRARGRVRPQALPRAGARPTVA